MYREIYEITVRENAELQKENRRLHDTVNAWYGKVHDAQVQCNRYAVDYERMSRSLYRAQTENWELLETVRAVSDEIRNACNGLQYVADTSNNVTNVRIRRMLDKIEKALAILE